MIPENCLDCMDRQGNMNPTSYMQPMMGGGYQQPMHMPFGMQQMGQMPFGMQPMGQAPYGMQPMGPMPYDTGAQQFQQDMGMQPGMDGQMMPGMQPGMEYQMMPGMQPGMGSQMMPGMQPGMEGQMMPGMQPGMGGQMMPGMQAEGGPDFAFEEGPPVTSNINYTQAYLRTKIGQRVKVEFLIGTNMLIDREGTLVEVGVSYIVINEVETDDLLLCDIYSIKFVRFYY